MRHLLVATAAALLLPAASAHAATVTLTTHAHVADREADYAVEVAIAAAPGERNDVTASWTRGETVVRVADASAPLQAGAGCQAAADGAIACAISTPTSPSSVTAKAALGDGDDRLTITGDLSGDADGGPGDDRLDASGTRAPALWRGGDGEDVLTGGAAGDGLAGGPGDDALSGGPGPDTALYDDHAVGVTVRLGGSAGNGAPGEDDTIAADVEEARGGPGDDVLIGDDGPNTLWGEDGDDRLDGRGGDDQLFGTRQEPRAPAPGADVLLGGDGRDLLQAIGPGARLDGGAGADRLQVTGAATADPGPGADLVLATGGGATVDARDDGGADLVRCLGHRPARAVVLDDRDFSDACGAQVRVPGARPRPLALLGARGEPLLSRFFPLNAYLTCNDAARRGCRVRIAVRAASGQTVLARRLALRPGGRFQLVLRPSWPEIHRLVHGHLRSARVAIVMSGRSPGGPVQTLRLRGTVYRGSDRTVEGDIDPPGAAPLPGPPLG